MKKEPDIFDLLKKFRPGLLEESGLTPQAAKALDEIIDAMPRDRKELTEWAATNQKKYALAVKFAEDLRALEAGTGTQQPPHPGGTAQPASAEPVPAAQKPAEQPGSLKVVAPTPPAPESDAEAANILTLVSNPKVLAALKKALLELQQESPTAKA